MTMQTDTDTDTDSGHCGAVRLTAGPDLAGRQQISAVAAWR